MLSNLNLNMLQALGFGLKVQQDGKEYIGIARLNDRLFLAIDPTEKMPANVKLVQADLAISDGAPAPQPSPAAGAGQMQTPKKATEPEKETGEGQSEKTDAPPVNPVS